MLQQRTQYFCHQFVLHPKGTVDCESLGCLLHTGHFNIQKQIWGLRVDPLKVWCNFRAVSKINTETGDKINVKCFSCCDCIFLFLLIHSFYMYLDSSPLPAPRLFAAVFDFIPKWDQPYNTAGSGPQRKEQQELFAQKRPCTMSRSNFCDSELMSRHSSPGIHCVSLMPAVWFSQSWTYTAFPN